MIEILIADDHPIIREGLKQILKIPTNIFIKDEASNGEEVLKLLKNNHYDLILLDLSLPKKNGIEVLKEIRKKYPKLPILILSIHSDEHFIIEALRNGASGYITKDSIPEELILAIKNVYNGQIFINQKVAEKIISKIKLNKGQLPHNLLSPREYQVMIKIGQGKSLKEISEELSLSVKTISTYRARILEKMELKSNAQIIKYVIENNLLY